MLSKRIVDLMLDVCSRPITREIQDRIDYYGRFPKIKVNYNIDQKSQEKPPEQS